MTSGLKMTDAGKKTLKDALVKPDMTAVLSRTHITLDAHGFLLPIFEAVSNAIHGIEVRYEGRAQSEGRIDISFTNANDPSNILISVTDNGVGLDDINYNSFKTPFSGHKLTKRGRGFGRFIAFKVFSRILYSSRYEFVGAEFLRAFRFDIHQQDEFIYFDAEPDFAHVGMRVEYNAPLRPWHDLIRQIKQHEVSDQIASHFLPQFLYGWLPDITISFDGGEPESITSIFKGIFVESGNGELKVEIDGINETIKYSLSKIPKTKSFKNHCLLFAAADRIVGSARDLTNIIGTPNFKDENNEDYIVLAVVRGDVFENRLNDARTGINLSPKDVERIVGAISQVIQENESLQIAKIKASQSLDLVDALRENPILRIGLRGKTVDEYVNKKPNNWTAQQFVSDLAIERFRSSKDLTKAITLAAANPDHYESSIKQIVEKIDESNKEALAEYIVHRKRVIEMIEAARKYDEKNGIAPEDVIHDLIFKRFSDNSKLEYFEHNLWVIDDALAFLPYISSDRTARGGIRRKGDKVPDLAFFDDSLILGDADGTTVTIVEFKRPGRNDYTFGPSKTDPVKQILDTLECAEGAGGFNRADGTHMSFTRVIRRFGYLIADHTPTLVSVLRTHDFKCGQNPNIYYRFRDNEQVFIQAIGYSTLVENAKKRNQAFFSVLLGE